MEFSHQIFDGKTLEARTRGIECGLLFMLYVLGDNSIAMSNVRMTG